MMKSKMNLNAVIIIMKVMFSANKEINILLMNNQPSVA